MEETSVEGLALYHHSWIVVQIRARLNLVSMFA
jgi:hypothetical protein